MPTHLISLRSKFNVNNLSTSRSKLLQFLRFSHKKFAIISILLHTCHIPSLTTLFKFIKLATAVEDTNSRDSSLFSLVFLPVISSLLSTTIFLTTFFSHTLKLWSSLYVRHLVSNPHKQEAKLHSCVIYSCS